MELLNIDELQGVSAFYRDKNGSIYHTYSSYARGIDLMNTTHNFLDLTANCRASRSVCIQRVGLPPGFGVRRHPSSLRFDVAW